jgi:hypothetical protein
VLACSSWLYVHTAEGGIWGCGWRDGVFCGIDGSAEENGKVDTLTRVHTALSHVFEWPAPPFALMAADEFNVVAVDRDGRLYAAGHSFRSDVAGEGGWLGCLTAMPSPPAPIRDVLAGLDHRDRSEFCLAPEQLHNFESPLHTVPELPSSDNPCLGPLALLVDGTVWSVIGQVRLQVPTGVVRFGPQQLQLQLMGPGGQRKTARPAQLCKQTRW